jgi:hypothetical protein
VYRECVLAVVHGAVVAYDDQVRLRCSGATIDAILAQLLCGEGLHFLWVFYNHKGASIYQEFQPPYFIVS